VPAPAETAPGSPSPSPRDPRVERLLFWIPFLSFAYFYQGADQSTADRFDLMRALLERRTLAIDSYCGMNTADIISLSGHYYSVKAPGGSFSGILQWLFFTVVLSPLYANHTALYWALATWLTIIFSTSLIIAISCVTMYRLVLALGGSGGRAVACALLLPFATIMFPYATEMTGEPIAGACALIAFYLLATQRPTDAAGRAMLAGALAGWAVLCDFPALLIALALAVYALRRLGLTRPLLAFGLGAGAVAAILLAYNQAAFGHPFFLSYEAYKMSGNSQLFPEQSVGFVGLTYPRPAILGKILLDPQRGLFFCNPVLLLSIPGFWCLARRRGLLAECGVAVFAAVGMVLFNASFGESIVSWGGGTATGPRQIVAAVPFMVLALAFLPAGWNWLMALLAAPSLLAMLMATAIEPHFPYEYENPLRDFVWQAYLRGDFAYDRDAFFGGAAIVDESTAFNLAKLARIPGPLQLWPLAALWMLGAWRLLGRCVEGSRQRVWRHRTVGALGVLFVLPLLGILATRMRPVPAHGLRGRYYRELQPNGFPPHVDRVDPELELGNVGAMGAMPAPSRVVWSGTLTVPADGVYQFLVQADDSAWLTIDGQPVIPDPGPVELESGSGSRALTKGPHRIEAGERNLGGDASMRLSWAPPNGEMATIPSAVLTPD
jgi:hypothetical protein